MRRFLCLLLLVLGGCAAVPFNERERVSSPLMGSARGSMTHFQQKIFYSREGAAGGIGESAGGGCGCY